MQAQGLLSGTRLPSKSQHLVPTPVVSRLHTRTCSHSVSRLTTAPAASQSSRQRIQVSAVSASIDDRTASSAGDSPEESPVASVPLATEADRDYTALRDALAAGDFQKADDITREELIQLAGPDAKKRGWVYFTEVKFIPAADLQTIDALWKASSNNKFGYSVQREIWLQQSKYWSRFFKRIDWTQGENNNYRKWPQEFFYTVEKAPKGHLPLTNALRGTQLFQAILEHPAFVKEGSSGSSGKPDWMK